VEKRPRLQTGYRPRKKSPFPVNTRPFRINEILSTITRSATAMLNPLPSRGIGAGHCQGKRSIEFGELP